MLVPAIVQSRKTHRARPQVASGLRLVLVVALAGLLCSLAPPASAGDSRVGSANQLAVPQPVVAQSTRGEVAEGNAVIGWGVDYLGGVGVGDTSPEIGNWAVTHPTPVAVTSALAGRTVTKVVSAWQAGTCALASGDLVCWRSRQLAERDQDTTAFTGGSLTDFDMSDEVTCAISAGKAYCRGYNDQGQLGNNSPNGSAVFMPVWDQGVLAGRTVQQIGVGGFAACALADGMVSCWGNNYFGQLGNGASGNGTNTSVPVAVDTTGVLNGLRVDQIGVGSHGACALAQGQVYCWGKQPTLGSAALYPGETFMPTPREIDTSGALSGKIITRLEMQGETACVLANGAPYCWGVGAYLWGQGTWNSESLIPLEVKSTALTGKTATDLVVGGTSCVLVSGAPVCWGNNSGGELGIGTYDRTEEAVATYTGGALSGRTITRLGGGGTAAFAITAEPAGVSTAPGTFTAAGPTRVLDTRTGIGGRVGAIAGGGHFDVRVAGAQGIPVSASAVSVNLTVTEPVTAGYLTVYPTAAAPPGVSNVNFGQGRTIANMAVVEIGDAGRITVGNGSPGSANVIVDVTGYYMGGSPTTPGAYRPVAPTRLLDTRTGTGAPTRQIDPQAEVRLSIGGKAGIPRDAVSAAVLNLTVTGQRSAGHITAYAGDSTRPATSNLNFTTGDTVAAMAVVPVGADGTVTLFNGSASSQVDMIADVVGYYTGGTPTAAGAYIPVDPVRIVDSRTSLSRLGPLPAGASDQFVVAGSNGLPRWAVATAMLNVTVVAPTRAGYVSIRPAEATGAPGTSTINFNLGETIANNAISPGRGQVTNGSSGDVDIVLDVFGYFHN